MLYGPAKSGKTTFLEWLYHKEGLSSGKLQQLKDAKGNTLFFDRVVSRVADVIFQCNSVPGAQQHTIQRKTILEGADGIIFVWDTQNTKWEENLWSFEELLRLYSHKVIPDDDGLSEVPFVMVANKRDLQQITPVDKIKEVLVGTGLGNTLIYETIATRGINLKKTFVYCAREITMKYYKKYSGMEARGTS